MRSPVNSPIMSPELYSDTEFYNKEMKETFLSGWIFVGFTSELEKNKDFVTQQFGDVSIVVQNFSGALKAFLNVCSHRFAKIQCEKSGNRPLSCPYHSWTYDKDGIPSHIPNNDEYFKFSQEDKKDLSLKSVEVAVCGKFVFISYNKPKSNLKEFLGDYWGVLEHLSEVFNHNVKNDILPWEANWKIGVESVLEVYHVNAVHPQSFKPFVLEKWEIEYHADHSRGIAYLSEKSAKWWKGVAKKMKLKQSELYKNYDHFFIYPNLAIGLTSGYLMSVQTYDPTGPESCNLHYRLFLANSDIPEKMSGPLYNAVTQNFITFNQQVLEEDRVISQSVQKGTKVAQNKAVPGSNEGRIYHFHKTHLNNMGVDNGD